jgi:hypothetical protein
VTAPSSNETAPPHAQIRRRDENQHETAFSLRPPPRSKSDRSLRTQSRCPNESKNKSTPATASPQSRIVELPQTSADRLKNRKNRSVFMAGHPGS